MEYNAVSQCDDRDDRDDASDTSDSPSHPSRPEFQKLTLDIGNLGGPSYMNTAKIGDQPSPVSLGSVIRSLGPAPANSYEPYDMLDEDDYTAAVADPGDTSTVTNISLPPGPPPQPTSSSPSHNYNYNTTTTNNNGSSSDRRHTAATPASPDEPVIHSPVSARPVPLRHPTPDLQSLQGAYVGNVERLEKSAETLNSTSDIGEELRKLKLEQKRPSLSSAGSYAGADPLGSTSPTRKFSTSSLSNSIIGVNNAARSSGYSPGGYVSSPKGSIMSVSSSQGNASRVRSGSIASRLAKVPEPENEDQPSPSYETPYIAPVLPPPELHLYDSQLQQPPVPNNQTQHGYLDIPEEEERPTTAGSTDTYRQSTILFKDFDGVHFTPHPRERASHRRVSLTKPPLARESRSFDNPPPGQNMVYYPAPVPMVLNLPQKLSKRNPDPIHEKRRSHVISTLQPNARKSAAWLPAPEEKEAVDKGHMKKISELPPQLRASAFFEQPSVQLDIQVKQNSAVATLDSILDAAAQAPVSAFTDHPIAGHVGAEVYGKPKVRKSAKPKAEKAEKADKAEKKGKNVLRKSPGARDSVMQQSNETEGRAAEGSEEVTPFKESYEGDGAVRDYLGVDLPNDPGQGDNSERDEGRGSDNSNDEEDDDSEEEEEDEEEETYTGPPTTLLAELQMRKQELKQRSRTAATAFPAGMHSTLLELDAVAQHQRKTRNQKQITLAWEDPGIAERNEPDDEDVPLAVLFPKNIQSDENRPMGLMEKLQLEENEPLSRRRARIRGEPLIPRNSPSPLNRAGAGAADDNNNNDAEEEEEETLAQRARRLKAEEAAAQLSQEFTNELLSQFGAKSTDEPSEAADKTKDKQQPQQSSPTEEETLGQRRRRLQAEKAAGMAEGSFLATKQRHSMANILQAHPARNGGVAAAGGARLQPQQVPNRMSVGMMQQQAYGGNGTKYAMNLSSHPAMGYGHAHGAGAGTGMGVHHPPMMGMGMAMNNGLGTGMPYANGYGYEPHTSTAQQGMPPIDSGQRDIIDRWRQSVRN
ncbi:hypothetical protein AJ79_00387 [Helicocarpus griseus UAMH5409]|uniref:Uncharacterized protein n=1 Tax=Helicocarpus griseus UAMH5409 TaxID=1447875 RepID=A0A2B7YCH5_9EURO|nr:hypothetical protein AJ79_00387 [Helicocarpus griseus UAMH5409]